ncbi:MAG: GGDEF domain-containing protein [Pararhodobacter sp.]|nr:GGDEF domain-containing protein [Pararhodobacter sp.]
MYAPVQLAEATPVTTGACAPVPPAPQAIAPSHPAPAPLALPAPAQFDAVVSIIKSVFRVPAVGIALHGSSGATGTRGSGVYRSFLEMPLIRPAEDGGEDEVIGALRVLDTVERSFSDEDCTMLEGFARLIVDQVELWSEASRDQLTGAMTRRAFNDALKKTFAMHQRHGGTATLLMFDLDHFKAINDTYGHAVGDAVLRKVARVVRGELRVEDSFGRLGGEEFAIILAHADATAAGEVAERIRRAIEAAQLPDMPQVAFTASFGLVPGDSALSSAAEWLEAADAALYRAKTSGRNRVVAAAANACADARAV